MVFWVMTQTCSLVSDRWVPMCQRNILPPYSGFNPEDGDNIIPPSNYIFYKRKESYIKLAYGCVYLYKIL
jgi:hypothetical protein